jgi:hypothetical protein
LVNKIGRYVATLPERATRAGAAVVGGVLRETSTVALPPAIRQSRLYQAIVARLLRIAIELVGDVKSVYPVEAMPVKELAVRKTAGNVVELASIVAVGWSPLWVLAAAADVIGGSKAYLRALVAELEAARMLPAGSDVASYEDLLTRLESTSTVLADAVDVPPLRLGDARAALTTLRQQAADLPSPGELTRLFEVLQATARPAEVSAAIGLAAARAGIELGNVHVFAYYQDALRAIADEGLLTYLRRVLQPYLTRAVGHFRPGAATYTDRALDWAERRFGNRQGPSPTEVGELPDGRTSERVIRTGGGPVAPLAITGGGSDPGGAAAASDGADAAAR